jgi:hypothetical protein
MSSGAGATPTEVSSQYSAPNKQRRNVPGGETGPTNDEYSYSRDAAKAMLDIAWVKMKGLYADLGLAPPN